MKIVKALAQVAHREYAVRANVHVGSELFMGQGSSCWTPSRLTIGDRARDGKGCTIEVDGKGGRDVLTVAVGSVGGLDHDSPQAATSITRAACAGYDETGSVRPPRSVLTSGAVVRRWGPAESPSDAVESSRPGPL